MSRLTNRDKANMHFIYGLCNGNTCRIEERVSTTILYPECLAPSCGVFQRNHQKFRETGSFGEQYEIGTEHSNR